MTERLLHGLTASTAGLVVFISVAGTFGLAIGASRQLRTPQMATRALEPGFTGTFQYRNDNFRTGQNLAETMLTQSTVNPAKFGLQFTDAIDGAAYAQPLYIPNVTIGTEGSTT